MTRIVFIVLCSAVRYAVLPVSILMLSGMTRPATADGPHTLTIYVEEGSPNGHVFVGISDGIQTEKWGWYTQGKTTTQKLPGLIGCAGGLLKRDDATPYNVSKRYPISRHDYFVIKSQVIARQAGGEYGTASWSPFKHCGHFALDVAQAANIDIPLKSPNPGALARYLRAHGGVEVSRSCSRGQGTHVAKGNAISVAGNALTYADPATRATNTIRWNDPPPSIKSGEDLTLISLSTHNPGARIEVHWQHGNLIARGADSAVNVGGSEKSTFRQFRGGRLDLVGGIKGHLRSTDPGYFQFRWEYTCR